MPIYEYRCRTCGHELEKLQRMSEDPLRDCPDCGRPDLHRLVSAAGFRLKGSGWYETDFKTSSKKNLHDTGEAPKSDSKSESDKSGDSAKPAEQKVADGKPAVESSSAV